MKSKQIMELIIEAVPKYVKILNDSGFKIKLVDCDGNLVCNVDDVVVTVPSEVVIFSHKFCKEFFGEKKIGITDKKINFDRKFTPWKFHIKRLALTEPDERLIYFIPFLLRNKLLRNK